MTRLLDTPIRDLLRSIGCSLIVGTVLWLPLIVALLREPPTT